MTTMVLKYEPLDLSSRQIRLLTLLPVSDTLNDPVSATLRIASLDDEPEFDSLSYVWGDEEDTRDIIVNGHTTKVTKNLEAALRRLRESTPRVLWVDALCINQRDIAEKNHQVPFMTQIYTTCQQAVIWLGEGNSSIEELFKWLNSARCGESANDTSMNILRRRPCNETTYLGYLDVFELPYWQRMWTYQEMILPANDPICVYGNQSSPFSVIVESQTHFDLIEGCDKKLLAIEEAKLGLSSEEASIRRNVCSKIALAAEETRRRKEEIFLALHLYLSAGRTSKDPRDRIYALYGLHPDIQRLYPAEYKGHHQSLNRVLIETTGYLVRHDSGFMVLAQLFRMHQDRFSGASLPSWVPDYNLITDQDHDWPSARSLRRRPTGSRQPSARKRDTTMMVDIRGVNVRSHQEPISTSELADLSDSMLPNEQENGFVSDPVNDLGSDLLGVGYDLHQGLAAASQEGQYGEAIRSRFLNQGGRLTLRLAGRHIGVCEKIHTFDADNLDNRIKLYKIIEETMSDPNLLDMMLLALRRPGWLKDVARSSLGELRTACEVAMCREPSGGDTKLTAWLVYGPDYGARRGMSSAEADEEERLLRLFRNFVVDSSATIRTKTLFVAPGEPVLVGIGVEAVQCGDIIMIPVDVEEDGSPLEVGGPLVLRKLDSNDANTAGQESQNQQAHTNREGPTYYKLVGPVMIPPLTEESELVYRLAQRPVEDFLIQ